MTPTQQMNPYEPPAAGTAVRQEPRTEPSDRGPSMMETLLLTGAIASVAVFVMAAARGGPRSDLPTLHSASSYIITFRRAASGPGQAIGWLIALVVLSLPGVLLHGLVWLGESWTRYGKSSNSPKMKAVRRGVFWLSIAYATGWAICLLV